MVAGYSIRWLCSHLKLLRAGGTLTALVSLSSDLLLVMVLVALSVGKSWLPGAGLLGFLIYAGGYFWLLGCGTFVPGILCYLLFIWNH